MKTDSIQPTKIVPKLKKIIPLHEKEQNYNIKRKEIFNELDSEMLTENNDTRVSNPDKKNISRKGVRQRFYMRKTIAKKIAAATLDSISDTRKFASVKIFDIQVDGLLDSGATVSCLGKGALEFLSKHGLEFSKFSSDIKTANGGISKIIGRVNCEIEFKGVKRNITLFISPSLSQFLYLGCDFWDNFSLWPFSLQEMVKTECQNSPKSHDLTPERTMELNNIINSFPSFETKGLGKTHILEHKIDRILHREITLLPS